MAAQMVRRGGVIACSGSFTAPQEYNIREIIGMEKDLIQVWSYGMWGYKDEFKIGLDLLNEGVINVKPQITHRFSLDRINEAFDCAANKRENKSIKVQIIP